MPVRLLRGSAGLIRFVRMRETDLPLAQQIYNYYSLHSTATFHDASVTLEEFTGCIDTRSPEYPSFLIEENKNLVGYCGIRRYKSLKAYDRTAEVTIYLAPEHTGLGIGRAALGYLEAEARKACIQVLIGIITGENYPSVRLFERMGYVQCARLVNVGELSGRLLDVLFYEKEL
ncbi:MAG: N-acetyltransferase family protein [Methanoregula sp.]